MPASSIVNSQCFASIDTYANLGGWVIGVFTRVCQDVDDQLCDHDGTMNTDCFRIIGFGYDGMKPLIVEIDLDCINAIENAVYCSIVEIQESQRSAMADLAFDVGNVQHIADVQYVGIEMYAVDSVSDRVGEVPQIGVAHVLLDFNVPEGKSRDLLVDPFGGAILVPSTCSHGLPHSDVALAIRQVGGCIRNRCRLNWVRRT
jgi:hypothetical protein